MKFKLSKPLKLISSLILTTSLVFSAASSAAFAANEATKIPNKDGDDVKKGVVEFETTDNEVAYVNIPKGLTFLNELEGEYFITEKTFSYRITPLTANDLKDGNGNPLYVFDGVNTTEIKPGNSSGLSTSSTSVKFLAGKYNFSPNGNDTEQTKYIRIGFNPRNFSSTGIGIYRYKIEDTTTDNTLKNMGIQRAKDYDKTRYLDVYVKSNQNNFAISGFVLLKDNCSIDSRLETIDESGNTVPVASSKDGGFDRINEIGDHEDRVEDYGFEPGGAYMTDTYTSYNFTVDQTTTGTLGEKLNPAFPVRVYIREVSQDSRTGVVLKQGETETEYKSSDYSESRYGVDWHYDSDLGYYTYDYYRHDYWFLNINSSYSSSVLSLKNGGSFTVCGLPPCAKIQVYQKNDTYDNYKLTVKDANNNIIDSLENKETIQKNNSAATNGFSLTALTDYESDGHTISDKTSTTAYKATHYYDHLDEFSPTGLVLRFSPFAVIVVFGAAYFLISRRTRKDDDSGIIG